MFATGGRDGAILIWDTRAPAQNNDSINRAENCIFRGHDDHEHRAMTPSSSGKRNNMMFHHSSNATMPNACKSSITGLAFQNDFTLISCGSGDGVVKVWDLRRNYSCYKKEPLPKYSLPYAGSSTFKGFTNLTIDLSRFRLYVSCMDNTIYSYNIATYAPEPIQRYRGLKNGSYYIRTCLSADGRYLLSGSSDERAYIWDVTGVGRNNCLPIINLEGHEVEVSCVAWANTKDLRVVTSSDDALLKIWRVAPSELSDDESRQYHAQAIFNEANRRTVKRVAPKCRKIETFATPSTSGRTALKRTFAELVDSSAVPSTSSQTASSRKRARRLFSDEESKQLTESSSPVKLLKLSPLSERLDLNDVSHGITVGSCSTVVAATTTTTPTNRIALTFSSPTSNLPNYVLNGEAPHLPIISPKRKLKENVDWLTKIRKQKLLLSPSVQRLNQDMMNADASPTAAKRIRLDSPKLRCAGRSNSTNAADPSTSADSSAMPRTPNTSRRNSTTTPTSIRRFLRTTTPTVTSTTTPPPPTSDA